MGRHVRVILFVALLFSKGYPQSIELLSETMFHGAYYSVVISGNYAFCSAHGHLLSISFENPSAPELLAIRQFPSGTTSAFVQGNYAYFTGEQGACVAIVDISDPADPRTVSTFNTRANVYDIAVRGDYAYVPDYLGQLLIVNVADPGDPFVQSRLDIPNETYAVALRENFLYMVLSDSGLVVVDVADPAHPFIAAHVIPDSSGRHLLSDIAISGDYAYVADNYGGLRIFSLSNPILPVCVSAILPDSNGISKVIVDNNAAYCISPWHRLSIVDVTDPLAPSQVGYFEIENENPRRAAILGTRLFLLGNGYSGYGYVELLDVSDRANPGLLGSLHGCPFAPYYVALRGNYAFVGSSGMYSLDISDPSHPIKVGEFSGYASHVAIADSTAYAFTDSSRLLILDISNPESLRVLGRDTLFWSPYDIAASTGYVYVSYGSLGFDIVDVSNPQAPRVIRRFNSGASVTSMIWQGDYLYIMEGLQILDVGDPENPRLVGSCTPPYSPRDFSVSGNYAYLISWDTWHQGGRLTIIDVTDKANPFYVSDIEATGRPGGIYAEGDYVFLTEYENLIEVVDVSNPYSPVIISSRDSFGPGSELIVRDNILYVGGDLSLTILEFREPLAAHDDSRFLADAPDLRCFPNPSNSSVSFDYTLLETSLVRLSIYDISGRLLETIINEPQIGGAHHAAWESRDFSSGIYFARMRTGANSTVRKITLLK